MNGEIKRGRGRPSEDLTGRRFGRLTVLRYDHTDYNGNRYWRCDCDCGNRVTVGGRHLKNGSTTSCGCYRRENFGQKTHGMRNTRLYHIWDHMKQRCSNPSHNSYGRYGDRGIFVCDEWLSFENFRDWALTNGYEDGLTIDRINNNGGYCPENCRWADDITQQNNRSNNHHVTWGGETHTIAEWSRLFDVDYDILFYRIRRNNMRDFEEYFRENC